MKRFIDEDNYEIEVSQNWKMQTLLNSVKIMAPFLARRQWSLMIAPADVGEFICSDVPVAIISKVPLPPLYSPAPGMPQTELTVPLSKEVTLFSTFEDEPNVMVLNRREVARINSRTGMYSDRFMYSSGKDFLWLRSDDAICGARDLQEALKKEKRKEK
jgi:hypothetical protein